ncbi:MAG: hypothetical protein Q7T72_03705, partial [Bacteroidales bacterium]|nr:hypothetical protein [Bacteroidales bacterium]
MFTAIQILAILGMFFLTYLAFLSFGAPKKNLLFTKEDKENWDNSINKGIGKWFTATNIVGTLTSLATAYLFFIGNSKLFGWVIFICSLSIFFGSYVTNYFTKRILANEYLKNLFATKEQVGGVIATLFWRPKNKTAQHTAIIVKWLSILNIVAIIWLEFAFFSDIASRLFSITELHYKVLLVFSCSFIVIYFTVRYGLRGFVFADAFQSPIIAISAFALIIGSAILFSQQQIKIPTSEFFRPILSLKDCGIFALHVIFLNIFLVLVSEGHWLRIWIFGKNETQLQVKSLLATAFIWMMLTCVGFFAFTLSGSKIGEDAIISLLQGLNILSPIFLVFFWLGGIAALFSTADSQIYSFLLVNEFDTKKGKLNNKIMDKINPFLLSISFAIVFSIAYFLVRHFQLPFEKIVFIIMPLGLNLLPAFIRAAKGFDQKPWLILVSIG